MGIDKVVYWSLLSYLCVSLMFVKKHRSLFSWLSNFLFAKSLMAGSWAFSSSEIVDGSEGDHQGFNEVAGRKCLPGHYWCSKFSQPRWMSSFREKVQSPFLMKLHASKIEQKSPARMLCICRHSSVYRFLAGWWPSLGDGKKVRGWHLHGAWELDGPVYLPHGWHYPGPGWLQAL